tara:strand:- start:183 stop:512 length:330 start_codon:yes stop_codon:yes gene_type:complete
MATFKRATATAGTSITAVTTAHTSNPSIVVGLVAANTGATSDTIDITIGLASDYSANPTTFDYIIKNAPVPVGSTLSILDGKLVANQNDIIKAQSSNGTIDVTVSILEL